jgi:hypothetical protein
MAKYNWRLDIEEIEKLYNDGYSCQQIGKILGASRQAIWEKMVNAGSKRREKKLLPYIIYDGLKWTVSKTTGYYRLTNSRKVHIALHRYVWEKEKGNIPVGYEIHHIDGDKSNNNLNNLECLSKADHTRKYSPHHNQYKNNKTKGIV